MVSGKLVFLKVGFYSSPFWVFLLLRGLWSELHIQFFIIQIRTHNKTNVEHFGCSTLVLNDSIYQTLRENVTSSQFYQFKGHKAEMLAGLMSCPK